MPLPLGSPERYRQEIEPSKVLPIGTATVIPFATIRENEDHSAHGRLHMQAPRLSRYERLKRLLLEEFGASHSKAMGTE